MLYMDFFIDLFFIMLLFRVCGVFGYEQSELREVTGAERVKQSDRKQSGAKRSAQSGASEVPGAERVKYPERSE